MRNVLTIADLQFGSTGKGQIAGSVASIWRPDTVVTAWGPNAGHTYRDGDHKSVHSMLAVSALMESVRSILLGLGTVLQIEKLAEEITANKDYLRGKNLVIHPQAMIVTLQHSIA